MDVQFTMGRMNMQFTMVALLLSSIKWCLDEYHMSSIFVP
jgi:hypothetical protein